MKRYTWMAVMAAFAAVASFLIVPGAVQAQQATTSLNGTITDTSGAVVPGAAITITRTATGQVLKTTANSSGGYQFQQITPGTWAVQVSAAGFGDQSKIGELLVSKPATIDFKMSLGAVAQTVNVTAETSTLNTNDATLGNAVDNKTIQSLPMVDRNVPDLLSLQPGVLYLGQKVDTSNDTRTGTVNGVRSDQGNITMDGLDDNDVRFGYAFTGVLRETLDSVDQFRVTTGLANSDQGRSAGAQVNLITKSGTDKFHGGVYEYNRNTNTAANNWFNKQSQLAAGEPNKPGKYIRNTYGADVGGPIKHQKLFFFGNYEASHTRENAQALRTVPTASLQAGNVIYQHNGNPVILTPKDIAGMDPRCSANKTCPWGPGVDPNVTNVLKEYPTATGTAEGDGYNIGSYAFSAPNPTNLNTSIVRLDWYPTSRHQLFVRGNLQDDTTSDAPQFPGQPPAHNLRDNTKGIGAGDTWTITNNLVNDFRYGYARQGYAQGGVGCGAYIGLRFLDQPTAETCSTEVHVPVQNFIDNMTWTHGNHTLSYGADLRMITNFDSTDNDSYDFASTNYDWLGNGGNFTGDPNGSLNPLLINKPSVDDGFGTNYAIAAGLIVGLVPSTGGQFNFKVAPNGLTGSALPTGAPVSLSYHSNEFEYYIQDAWKVMPNLTLTFGIRHTFLQPPWETNGQQIQPTIDTHQWFKNRYTQAALGITDQPDLLYAPSGKAHGKASYWSMNYKNIAPRFALAYAPNNKTSIRAGAGMYYDHFGEGIVDTFATQGSFGLQTQINNPAGQYTIDNAPRFTGIQNLPPLRGVNIPSVIPYPYTPPNNVNTGFAITWGIDNKIQTPYTIATDLSLQRELPHGFSVEADYVGTFGRHLLQQPDIATPLNLVDPKSGMDYFTAATLLSKAAHAGRTTVPAIPYWENMFPYLATGGQSATQNIYTNVWASNASVANESNALAILDAYCAPSDGGLGCGPYAQPNGNTKTRYYQRQFSSLYSWSSIGVSSYNAAQLTLRRVTNVGLAFDFSYTFGNSMDMGSDGERSSIFSTGNGSFGWIVNAFDPKAMYAPSDFDTRHILTGHFVDQLPFGRGKKFANGSNRVTNAIIGGWTLAGITRWSSGLPFNIHPRLGFGTSFEEQSNSVITGPIKMRKHIDENGFPQVFDDPKAIINGMPKGSPVRFPYPGESGQRNNFRGDGYFEQDGSIAKSWNTHGSQNLRFAWEVFNVSNSARFDTSPVSSLGGLANDASESSLGVYSSELVQSRKQQFSLRYDF